MRLTLRSYQKECVAAHYSWFARNKTGNPLFVIPTGGGKSLVLAEFIKRTLDAWPGQRVLVLTHVKELISQNHGEFVNHLGQDDVLAMAFGKEDAIKIGIYSAGLGRRETRCKVLFAGIQSIYNRAEELGHFDIVLIDECVEAGTTIDGKPIENLIPGDYVSSWNESEGRVVARRVHAISKRLTSSPTIIIQAGGRTLRCTPNHPIWVEGHGFKEASSLRQGETVRMLEMSRDILADGQPEKRGETRLSIILFESMHERNLGQRSFEVHAKTQFDVDSRCEGEGFEDDAGYATPTSATGRERATHAHAAAQAVEIAWQGMESRGCDSNGYQERKGCDLVFGRCLQPEGEISRGGGRKFAQDNRGATTRCSSRPRSFSARIQNVEILQSGSRGRPRQRPVFNLQMEGEENYFANGILTHNCHLVPKKGLGRYLTYLETLKQINPAVKVCGYTATHYRMEGGYLHKGEGRIFTDVAYEVSLEELVRDGYLAPLVAKACKNTIDTTGIATVRGDFKASELEEAAIEVVEAAVFETVMLAGMHDRHHWLIFAAGVAHAKMIAKLLFEQDVQVATVFGDTPKDERDRVIERFRDGKLTALVNVGVLTTGFNAPCCDLMAVMRPTKSTSLYVQMAGRGMRTHPKKANCLYLDYGENVMRHGPINKVRPRDGDGSGVTPTKVCPDCASIVALGVRACPECGYLWPWEPPVRSQTTRATELAPFDPSANEPRMFDVFGMHFRRHEKQGRPDSLRVDFTCGMRVISTWVCIEHDGFPGRKAVQWWFDHGGHAPAPTTVDDALARSRELRKPRAIQVVDDGDFERVQKALFDEEEAEL